MAGDRAQAAWRLFVALWPPAPLRARAAALARERSRGGRLIPEGNIHLTVSFLGDIPRAQVTQVSAAIERAEPRALLGLSLSLDRIGWLRRGGLLWLLPSHTPEELRAFHGRLSEQLQGIGLATERRPFRAHLTLGRKVVQADEGPIEPLAWTLGPVSLVRSQRDHRGSVYQTIAQVPRARATEPDGGAQG